MAKGFYLGDPATGLARKVKKLYIGDPVTGVARKVKKVYIGDPTTGLARLCWAAYDSVWARTLYVDSMFELQRSFDRGNTWELVLRDTEIRTNIIAYGCGGIVFLTYSNGYKLKYIADNSNVIQDCSIPYPNSIAPSFIASTNNRIIVVYYQQNQNAYTFETTDGINFVDKNGTTSIGSNYYTSGRIFGFPVLDSFYMPHGSTGNTNIWSSISGGIWTDIANALNDSSMMNYLTFFRGTNRFIAMNTPGGIYLYTVGLTNFQPDTIASWTFINKSSDFNINYAYSIASNKSIIVSLFRDPSNVLWLMYSSDGVTWTKSQSFGIVTGVPKVLFDGEVFVFCTASYIYSSKDGISWSAQSGSNYRDITVKEA